LKQDTNYVVVIVARCVFTLPMRNWNSYRPHKIAIILSVFTLPMRNWNKEQYIKKRRTVRFLRYLWGIETNLAMVDKFREHPFLRYLWGIETYTFWPYFC